VTVKGTVTLIGSGELSGTMVETHKMLLSRTGAGSKAFFLDTPAGFQENVNLIAERAVDFFKKRVGSNMEIASFKTAADPGAGAAVSQLGEADYVLIGPGSPTYTVRQLQGTAVPALLSAMVTRGGALTVASAAALTVGSHTLPVYEIYKVGEDLHWVEGLNILSHLGLNLVVVPHWNNAEGGNHDTRFCYMGEKRFRTLEGMLPAGSTILGLDEHTACVLDFKTAEAFVKGLGAVTIRRDGQEIQYEHGQKFGFEQLSKTTASVSYTAVNTATGTADSEQQHHEDGRFWARMHRMEEDFHHALEQNDAARMASLLLDMDGFLWQAQLELENPEFISQGREIFRELIVLAGTGQGQEDSPPLPSLEKLVNQLIDLREQYRREKKWSGADHLRNLLHDAGITVEDTPAGPKWHFTGE